jgi:hypothetical protein
MASPLFRAHDPNLAKSIAAIPQFGPIEGHRHVSGFSRFPANESLRRTGLHLSLSAKSSFYTPAFEIFRSCPTASGYRRPVQKNCLFSLKTAV